MPLIVTLECAGCRVELVKAVLGPSPKGPKAIEKHRVDVIIEFFQAIGLFDGVLHPWFDVWLPKESVESYVGEVVPSLTPEDVGPTGFFVSTRARPTCSSDRNACL